MDLILVLVRGRVELVPCSRSSSRVFVASNVYDDLVLLELELLTWAKESDDEVVDVIDVGGT